MAVARIEEAIEDIRQGKMIILVDDEDRENEGDLTMAAEKVTPELLIARGFIKKLGDGVKILGDGELKAPLTIFAHRFSKSALEKIQQAGGKAEVIRA